MEKAIEIKRRAQRCIQNNDLDGALSEYEKLVQSDEADPYNYVLLADLLFKKGDPGQAADRYLSAVDSYERASLYKNAIAVCKKMLRLSLSQARVLKSLANLHALDGFAGESALYYVQYAEQMVRSNLPAEASWALRAAFDVCQDNVRVLEQLSESYLLAGDNTQAAAALLEAAGHYRSRGQESDAARCSTRATQLDANAVASEPVLSMPIHSGPDSMPKPVMDFEPGVVSMDSQAVLADSAPAEPAAPATSDRVEGLESGRVMFGSAPTEDRLETTEQPAAPAASEPVVESEQLIEPVQPDESEQVWESVQTEVPEQVEESGIEVVEIVEEDPAAALEAAVAAYDPPSDEAGVYEIQADEEPDASVYEIAEEAEAMVRGDSFDSFDAGDAGSSSAPGLAFTPQPERELEPVSAPASEAPNLDSVEHLLAQAQEQFRSGDRELASRTLAAAAQAYEQLGRLDNAATIYRSLGRGAQSTLEVITLWLGNCQSRGDAREAAQVACELGDRALNDGDERIAREWFEQATAFDADNEVAKRRLQRLAASNGTPAGGGVAVAATPAEGAASAPFEGGEAGRVEVAVGRGEAVTFDLSSLLAEFQRGVEAQLSGDAQSHYDLGMTYREMGLVDQAIESFQIAEQDPRLSTRALEMTGRCFLDQHRYLEAVGAFERAVAQPNLDSTGAAELRYQLAQAHEAAGDPAAALREYQAVAEVLSDYEDVDARIASLGGAAGPA